MDPEKALPDTPNGKNPGGGRIAFFLSKALQGVQREANADSAREKSLG